MDEPDSDKLFNHSDRKVKIIIRYIFYFNELNTFARQSS